MTVKANESGESVMASVAGGDKKVDWSHSVLKSKNLIFQLEMEMEQESGESSEEVESPRSVSRWRRRRRNNNNNNKKEKELIHSQILRIREEDSNLGEDNSRVVPSTLDVVVFSRPNLPCSPLGGKTTTVKALH